MLFTPALTLMRTSIQREADQQISCVNVGPYCMPSPRPNRPPSLRPEPLDRFDERGFSINEIPPSRNPNHNAKTRRDISRAVHGVLHGP